MGLLALVAALAGLTLIGAWNHLPLHYNKDFTSDYVSARAWAEHRDPYGVDSVTLGDIYLDDLDQSNPYIWPDLARNPHLPFHLLLIRPFSIFSFPMANALWTLATIAAFAGALALFSKEIRLERRNVLLLFLALIGIGPTRSDILWGQVNSVMLLLLVLGWVYLRRDREVVAGVALGLAVAIKGYPVLLAVPLWRLGKRRALTSMLGTAIAVTLAAGSLIGPSFVVTLFGENLMQNTELWRSSPSNIAVTAIPYRWLTSTPWQPQAPNLPIVASALSFALVVVCLVALWRAVATTTSDPFWATLPWIILISPLAWNHTMVLAIPVVLLGLRRLTDASMPWRGLYVLGATLVLTAMPPWAVEGAHPTAFEWATGPLLATLGLLAIGLADLTSSP